MRAIRTLYALICLLACTAAAAAEAPHISLLTCHAGPDIYELCGHSAIRVRYPDSGIDYAANYGLFDFDSPGFIYRFVKGETDYMVGAHPYEMFLANYSRQGRKVVEQHLDLTPEQATRLAALLEENMRPENRVYRYNYVLDNCATRCIDILERAMADTIHFDAVAVEGTDGWSFRDEMRHYHRNYPWYQFGIDLALGTGIDYPITVREKSFAPEMMERLFASASLPDSTGQLKPLVSATNIVAEGTGAPATKSPTPWYLTPMAVCWTLFVIVAAISATDIRHHKHSRWLDTILFGAFGLAGCLIFFLVFISEHYATSPNWLIVWLNPLCLCGAILPWIKKCGNVAAYYHTANLAVVTLLLLLWRCTGQGYNWAFLPLMLSDMARSATYIYNWKCIRKKNIA